MLTRLQPPTWWHHGLAFALLLCWSTSPLLAVPGNDLTGEPDPAAFTVQGTVTDGTNGDALPGVNVLLKGTATTGTITDATGNYSLTVPSPNDTLLFTSIGFAAREVPINGQAELNVTLDEDIQSLEEVVVVGYGTQEKVNLTGAVGVTDGEVLENRPIANVGEGLQGVVPNLNVNLRNGDPSEPADFNIRGFESINGGSPLILVDNVPMDINRINPNDIESVTVLKDAASAAVYGARAAFGVVLITTKKGRGEKISVNLSAQTALSKPIFFIDPITDPYQFVQARNMATMRTDGAPAYNPDFVEATRRYSENPTFENTWGVVNGQLQFYGYNNYVNELITEYAPQQNYDISVSGASEKASYYVSFGHLNKDGYLRNDERNENFKRYNALIKGDFQVADWLKFDSRALITTEQSDKPHFYHWDVNINTSARQDPLDAIRFPDLPFYLEPGDRAEFEPFIGKYFGGTNFLPYLEDGGRETWTRNDIIMTQGLNLTPIKGLNIRGEFSANFTYRDEQDVQSKIEVISNKDLAGGLVLDNGFSGNDWIYNRSDNDQYYVVNTWADYTIDKNQHFLKAMVGFNQEWGRWERIETQASNLITPQITDISATTGNQVIAGQKQHTALRGAFYRVNYIYDDRYLIEANGRYDGSSRFPEDDRFGFFPSISVGWRISEEGFMSSTSSWLDNLKVRASYGQLGNQLIFADQQGRIPVYYPYIATLGAFNSSYMMASGSRTPVVTAPGLVSPTLTWETVITQNIGLDFTMFGNRLDVSFDVYTRDTKDMLTREELPAILGAAEPRQNAADLRTQGWELSATWQNRINSNWRYDINLALSDNISRITKYNNPSGSLNEYYEGQVVFDNNTGERWGFETVGIFQTDDEVANAADQSALGSNWRPGDIRYADLNGDGVISYGDNTLENPGDQRIIAYENPRYNFGVRSNVGWKNFTLSVFFQGVMKYQYWPPNGNWVAFYPFNAGHVEEYYLTDSWSETNRDAYFPAPHLSTNTKQNILPQTRYVQNAAYVRLKNLIFGYNLPENIASKVGMSNARIYFSGQNIWEFTKMRRPLDPEVRPTLTQEYYKQRTYSLGINVSF